MKAYWIKVWKKLDHFWEYYKWFAIIPFLVIVIIFSFIYGYISDNKPFSLGVAIVNSSEVGDAVYAFQNEYTKARGLELPVKVIYDLQHPKQSSGFSFLFSDTAANYQRYQGLVTNYNIDVTITTDWMVKEYMQVPFYMDLRECFDEEFLAAHEEDIYYVIKEELEYELKRMEAEADGYTFDDSEYENVNWEETGEKIPVGFYLGNYDAMGTFVDDAEPILAISVNTIRLEECVEFTKWILEQCEEDKEEDAG